MPIDSFHLDKVNQTFERLFSTYRNNNWARISAQNGFHLANDLKEISTRTVHFVHISNTRHIVLISLTPYSLRLRFNTTHCTICSNSTIQNTQRALYFSSEVNVSRSINQVDFISITCIFPTSCSSSRSNGNTTFLFLRHPVHCSSTIMYFSNFVSQTRIKQDTFRGCCFSGINVSHDTNITRQM